MSRELMQEQVLSPEQISEFHERGVLKFDFGFDEATQFTESLCPVGSEIKINQDEGQPYDRYDRMVAKVTCGGVVLNTALVATTKKKRKKKKRLSLQMT